MAEFATLAELKTHLNVSSTTHDGELTLMLDAAADVVRGLVGSFGAVAVTERVTATAGTVILSRSPVGAVTLTGGGLPVTGFAVNSAAGLLYDVPAAPRPLVATYTAGGGVVPAAVTLACLVIAAHLWETQRGTSPTALQAAATIEFVSGVGFTVPNRAKELLEPYTLTKPQVA